MRRDDVEKIHGGGDSKAMWGREGQMVSWGYGATKPTVTDEAGRFTIRIDKLERRLMAMDSGRRGGISTFDPSDPPETVEIRLAPLVRVKGSFRATNHPGPLPSTIARVHMPGDEPLWIMGVAMCVSLHSRFEFLLPPGRCELLGFSNDEKVDAIGNVPMFKTRPDPVFTVDSGRAEVDLGTIELGPYRNFSALEREARARGTFGDSRSRIGLRTAPWYITDAKGVAKGIQIKDFRGKWVLLYFWGTHCSPCLKASMPELSRLYEAHRPQRDKFEILAFCLDVEGELKNIADLDRVLEPVVRNVWGGKPLPFPVLLDNTFRTAESFGIAGYNIKLLIDPDGNVVEGDERTLAEKLRESWLTGFVATLAVRADDVPASLVDRFADEPNRLKAQAPIRFLESFHEARAEAGRSHRRILAYFTGRYCGWCRVMETRTLTDAEVVELSLGFVFVKLDAEKEPQLYDELGVDTIPRSFILSAEGARVDMLAGYRPAAEYAEWLRSGLVKPLAQLPDEKPEAPAAVGATENDASILVWFVDGPRTMKRWADPKAFDHPQLLQILRASGSSPRVEHLAFSDFPARWDRAAAARRLPDLIASETLPASARDLERQGRLLAVGSQRLAWMPGLASCPDFTRRFLHLVQGGPNESAIRRAVDEILKPGPETSLPGPRLPDAADPVGAEETARRAIVCYMSGDPRGLKEVASEASPQLARCTDAGAWRRGLEVRTGPIETRGGADLAFAKVEVTYRGKENLGADPFLVVLRRESSRWRAFAISGDVEVWEWLPELLGLLRSRDGAVAPATPRLVWPADHALLPDSKRPLAWEVPQGGEAVVAQVCMLMSEEFKADARGESWPLTTLKVRPGVPRGGSVPTGEYATGMPVRWCVWSIGVGGRMSVSEVRDYDFADYKQMRTSK
jgi:thiol-disulfide isomerase/thioredoxin